MKTEPIPRWKLERYVLGELSKKEKAAVERRIEECPEAARAVEEIRRSDAELRHRFPADEFVPRIVAAEARERKSASTAPRRRPFFRMLLPAAPVVAAAARLLVVMLREAPENRIKGSDAAASGPARIEVYRKAGASVETLKNGDTVRAGDLLQIAYVPTGKTFGVIASLDGRGSVTLHFPEMGTGSSRLKTGSLVKLETSYELDDAPDFECFYFITSLTEIDVREAVNRISAAAKTQPVSAGRRLDLPSGWDQFIIVFRKGNLP